MKKLIMYLVLLYGLSINAQIINISTGVDASGNPVAEGKLDTFWKISSKVNSNPTPAKITAYSAGRWEQTPISSANSGWINPMGYCCSNSIGSYTFERVFSVTRGTKKLNCDFKVAFDGTLISLELIGPNSSITPLTFASNGAYLSKTIQQTISNPIVGNWKIRAVIKFDNPQGGFLLSGYVTLNNSTRNINASQNVSTIGLNTMLELADSTKVDVCTNNLIMNGEFIVGTKSGEMPVGQSENWSTAYGNPLHGNPIVDNTPGIGSFDDGIIELNGNKLSGNAVSQKLNPLNKIISGKKYQFSVAVKLSKRSNLEYAKIRVLAYNGVLPSSGVHPSLNSNIALIGQSGTIMSCGDWSYIEFPSWKANKAYESISISVVNDDNVKTSIVLIDDVSMCDSQQNDCIELEIDKEGKAIIPSEYTTQIPPNFCPPIEEEDTYFSGNLADLYNYNGTESMYEDSMSDNCMSLGGTLPVEIEKYDCDSALSSTGEPIKCDELEKNLESLSLPVIPSVRWKLPKIKPLTKSPKSCKPVSQELKSQMAFAGRDIIYIHGLQLSHLCDKANGVSGTQNGWPTDKAEFYKNGYYKNIAENNFQYHINHFLTGAGRKNRYLIVTYNCSQRADVAVHSILSQIRDAMESGRDVVYNEADARGNQCFGQDYVIVSHSTGGLVTDLTLSIANATKLPGIERSKYGSVGFISDACKGTIAMHGAMLGSNLAKLMVDVQLPVLAQIASVGLTSGVTQCSPTLSTYVTQSQIQQSILVDLTPSVTYSLWSNYLNKVPKPVFTISGGHPDAIIGLLKYKMHTGFDDGVVTMESSSGRNKPFSSSFSELTASKKTKMFDMGININRAIRFYLDQHIQGSTFAVGGSTRISPTGMIQEGTSVSTLHPQFKNHFTFIQSASEHYMPDRTGYFNTNDYQGMNLNLPGINDEEVLVTTNGAIFSSGLVNPAIIGEMGETVKSKYICYPVLRFKMKRGIPRPYILWKRLYIWKRTYHKLNGDLYDMDYAYKYLFPN